MASRLKSADRTAAPRAPHVVPTKLRPPYVQEGLVERPELVDRLRSGRDRRLTLVCAPAGYGKTTLLAQWAAGAAEPSAFAWVSLDGMDSDPARLWVHVISALQEVHERAGERSLAAFSAGPSAIAETGLPLLVEELSDCPPVVLVLEDWHSVSSRVCDETMGAFVDRAPPEIQIVVSSRHDPHFPIARHRAHGELAEIRARDLSVSSTEAEALFRGADVDVSSREVGRLTERTEGWLAGLCLALLALKEQDDPERFVHEFSGDTRHVFDYLARDVLATADPEIRAFMERSSILDRLSAPLCDAVLETSVSASMLAEIERSNYFLVPLDATGTEFRYHHLFAAVLNRALETSDPGSVPGLHARASLWHEEHGDIERAVDHAIASGDLARSSTLILRAGVPLLSAGRVATLERWFDALSWPEARAERELAAMRALTAGLSGLGRDEIERWLAIAEDGPDYGPLANGITSISSMVAMVSSTYLSRGVAESERAARLVLESEPAGSPWRYAGLVPLGQALYLAGRREEARVPLEEARTLPGARSRATSVLAVAYLALIELADGHAERAQDLARDALTLADEIGHSATAAAANPHLALGCALMRGTDLHSAIEHLERAVALAGDDSPSYWHAHCLLYLAAARHRMGDLDGAKAVLARARSELDALPDVAILGELYQETSDALHHRPRREGFLGEELSEAESRVLNLLLEGFSITQAAHELWLSPNTVKTHRRGIYRKLGVSTRDELLARMEAHDPAAAAVSDIHPG